MAIEYSEYTKKYKKQIEENRKKWRKENEVKVSNTKKPVSTKKEEKKWYNDVFDSGAFNDGYDFGDVTKTILGTTADVGIGLVKGVSDIGVGAAKLGAGGIAQVADWVGQDEYAKRVRGNIAGKNKKTNEFLQKYREL